MRILSYITALSAALLVGCSTAQPQPAPVSVIENSEGCVFLQDEESDSGPFWMSWEEGMTLEQAVTRINAMRPPHSSFIEIRIANPNRDTEINMSASRYRRSPELRSTPLKPEDTVTVKRWRR